jgi:3-carboxy-cis,cis-muconate cycloisomerase
MAGRTLLQHAVPITFGLKAARWLAQITRAVHRLRDLRERSLAVQLGGAAGTLAALGAEGAKVMELVAQELGLPIPELPWHAERDRIAEIAAGVSIVASVMAKIGTDVALLAQTEVNEASSSATSSKGRSSAMPQKRNPVEATQAIACAQMVTGLLGTLLAGTHEHERAVGAWQAEWQIIPELFRYTSGAVMWTHRAISTLEVDSKRMRANLELTNGFIMAEALTMALAPHFGRPEAYRIVQEVCDRAAQSKTPLREVAAEDQRVRSVLPGDKLAHVLEVSAYLGTAHIFIDRALTRFRALHPDVPPKITP